VKKLREQLARRQPLLGLLLLTLAALVVHGYHPFAEDSEIYIAAIKKDLDPALYPYNSQFFMTHARLTLFDDLVAGSVNLTHLSLETVLLLWHLFSISLLLLACWMLASQCFREIRARWGAVASVAALLTLPVAGTALYLMDPYVNPRSLSTPAVLLAVVFALENKFVRAILWLVFSALVHPHMAGFGICFVALVAWMKHRRAVPAYACVLLPFGLSFSVPSEVDRVILERYTYFFLQDWRWYEWLGIFGPLVLLRWIARLARKHDLPVLELLSRSAIVFELAFFGAALVLEPFPGMAKLQPMRALHIVYLLLVLFLGGLAGQFVLRARAWRWLALFLPLCGGMAYAQHRLFSDTPHVEWPGTKLRNPWLQAFDWIRSNTPRDAVFALDPDHKILPQENSQGFRAISERSLLVDNMLDCSIAFMFPQLAPEWHRQSRALAGWKSFALPDFQRLKAVNRVTWVVLQGHPDVAGLPCPYHNELVQVCRIP
jgi:hypothetical protein